MSTCPKCGQKIDSNLNKCPNCGNKLDNKDNQINSLKSTHSILG